MKKTLKIEGMSCGHCKGRVEKALGGLDGVASVEVNLEAKTATIELTAEISNELLTETVDDAGYDVVGIE
ncbi:MULTISPECIES: heavy-metal-associated domain-containing protein [unclassified Fusibacter]|uniref:heavy-metal-associated domain-containing protein n=1 Tax=unclassified Fusibacter TaxID=2624464 RepID=UPI001012C3B6|nr:MULTISPECIES: copper ion binding protein [unclassified Fusibacter]MCK8059281.1 copper ion binding protein [Fusibacter sp. A2]NPE21255.1 heavy-metal-associated domain-containing protein [Fusibacter sp. A1]RXV62520.1 heavy-metal-associated domain-containing protein [Fusibacter sp. A1]